MECFGSSPMRLSRAGDENDHVTRDVRSNGLQKTFNLSRHLQKSLHNVKNLFSIKLFILCFNIITATSCICFSFMQHQSEEKSKSDSIKIVSRGHLPPAPAKGASRAAKMRAVARGDDTASTLKHEQQVSCNVLSWSWSWKTVLFFSEAWSLNAVLSVRFLFVLFLEKDPWDVETNRRSRSTSSCSVGWCVNSVAFHLQAILCHGW